MMQLPDLQYHSLVATRGVIKSLECNHFLKDLIWLFGSGVLSNICELQGTSSVGLERYQLPRAKLMKEQVLREMGVREPRSLDGKTPLMLLLESRYHQPIQVLIATGTVRKLAKELDVHYATISKWRTHFGLN